MYVLWISMAVNCNDTWRVRIMNSLNWKDHLTVGHGHCWSCKRRTYSNIVVVMNFNLESHTTCKSRKVENSLSLNDMFRPYGLVGLLTRTDLEGLGPKFWSVLVSFWTSGRRGYSTLSILDLMWFIFHRPLQGLQTFWCVMFHHSALIQDLGDPTWISGPPPI